MVTNEGMQELAWYEPYFCFCSNKSSSVLNKLQTTYSGLAVACIQGVAIIQIWSWILQLVCLCVYLSIKNNEANKEQSIVRDYVVCTVTFHWSVGSFESLCVCVCVCGGGGYIW